jgi:hypothetical protein
LIPAVGDTATAILGAYIVSEAAKLGVPRWTLLRMVGNLAIDLLIGAVPLVGDLFDFVWKANLMNADLLDAHFGTGTFDASPADSCPTARGVRR